MAVDMREFEAALALLDLDAELDSPDRVEGWLHDPTRTAHRLVSTPTAALMVEALADCPPAPTTSPLLPSGVWRVLPDRLLTWHPGRRAERTDRLYTTVARHLELTAEVLEQWGWAQTPGHWRTLGGRRCIIGAQAALFHLGYGTEGTAWEARRQIQGALARRGITLDLPQWNDLPTTTGPMALAVVRDAAKGA